MGAVADDLAVVPAREVEHGARPRVDKFERSVTQNHIRWARCVGLESWMVTPDGALHLCRSQGVHLFGSLSKSTLLSTFTMSLQYDYRPHLYDYRPHLWPRAARAFLRRVM